MIALGGCPRGDQPKSSSGAPPDAASAEAAIAADVDVPPAPKEGARSWTESMRSGKYADALDAIGKLPSGEQNKPEIRLAKARAANASGKHAEAMAALEKLEDELPLLRDLIAKLRAQAALHVGPHDKAAEYYAARSTPSSWLIAAEAWQKANDATKARVQCDRVVSADKRSVKLEEKARAMRMKIVRLKEGDAAAAADARWLAINGLDDAVVAEANEVLAKQSPPKPLTASEYLARGKALADAMRPDDAIRAIDRANGVPAIDLCRAKAEAYWKARTRYVDAGVMYRQCANMGGARAAEDLFLSARAYSRADKDADAIPGFQAVMQKHPRTTWAEQAEFHIARSYVLAGKWREAANAFDDYMKNWPRGSERKKEADRYRALAHLVALDNKLARKLLEDLAGSESADPVGAARWTNLAALAALRDGDKTHALARWSEVARSRPLSWAALVARARLVQNGASLPVTIEPAETAGTQEPPPVELPPPADMLHRIGLDGEAEEALRDREAVVVAKAQGRGTEALCSAHALVDRAKRRYQVSLGIPSQLLHTAPGPRNRWAWECSFPAPHRDAVRAQEARSKLPANLVWSVMRQESAFDAEVVSPARAVGLMQLLPETAKAVAATHKITHDDDKLTIPEHNIELGALYLKELLDKLGGNVPLAVAAYNAGPEAIERWLAHGKFGTIDVYVEAIPFLETRGYVVRVLGNLARYGYMEHGDQGVPSITLDLGK